MLLERADGKVAGIEVKAAIDIDARDLRHLVWLGDRLGDRWAGGVIVHLGDRARRWGPTLASLSVNALWQTSGSS